MTAAEDHPRPAARRRYLTFRFGLRGLLIGVAFVAIGCAVLASFLREGHRQRALAARLDAEWSHYEWVPVPGAPGSRRARSTLPRWVEAASLSPAFRRIQRVTLRGHTPTDCDRELSALAELGKVRTISVYGEGFGERELERLLTHVEVDQLYIESAQLSRGHLPCLSLQRLSWLCVARTQFSNPAIEDLPTSLTYLDATRTRITDEGLPAFIRLKKLRTLILCRTPTTAGAVERLRSQMPGCEISWELLQRTR